MTIKVKLIAGLGTLVVLSILLGGGGLLALRQSEADLAHLIDGQVRLNDAADAIRYIAAQHRRYEKDLFLNIGNQKKQEGYLKRFREEAANLQETINKLDAVIKIVPELEEKRGVVSALRTSHQNYVTDFEELAQRAIADPSITPQQANKLFGSAKEYIYTLEESTDSIVKFASAGMNDFIEEIVWHNKMLSMAMLGLTIFVAVFGFAAARWIFVSVEKPLGAIIDHTGQVAAGKLDHRSEFRFTGEMKTLFIAIEAMVASIRERILHNQAIINGIPDPIVVTDENRVITSVNAAAQSLLGTGNKPLADQPLRSCLNENFYTGEPPIETLARTGSANHALTFARQHEGKEYFYHSRAVGLLDHSGKVYGYMEVLQDITAVKRGELDAVRQSEHLAGIAQQAEGIAANLAGAAGILEEQVAEAALGAQQQQQRSSESATAMEEMNATVREVAQNASDTHTMTEDVRGRATRGSELVDGVVTAVNGLESHSRELRQEMEQLGRRAAETGQVLGVISDIADQTNLLALNAAIEAARAGDAGRGFAVVADEVRKLAEKTMQATKEVEDVIKGIQLSTERSVQATEVAVKSVAESRELAGEAGRMLHEIVSSVHAASDQVNSIATAAEEQSATSDEINRVIMEVNEISDATAVRMAEAEKAVRDLSEEAIALSKLIDSMRSNT
ncbi:methyl-accepting chemotaxis protein [Oleidesulfovibrio sp.]|uniref:methyl-accepting chemotaxis protein n=1 Tax=Oleidesulfovibrio sp. TaxID=2909707 RepID=UPI003A8395F6